MKITRIRSDCRSNLFIQPSTIGGFAKFRNIGKASAVKQCQKTKLE